VTIGKLKAELEALEVKKVDLRPVEKRPTSLVEALHGKVPPHVLVNLPKSMDVIGDVAIVELPDEVMGHDKLIGETVLSMNRRVRTVLAKASAIAGVRRLRKFKVIAGNGETETRHKEHGCVYNLDVRKVYFSPRLSYERDRIASQVRDGEVVLDMFAGVGPFSILMAKRRKVKVYAVDLNPDAVFYLKQNITINKLQGKVVAILGDVRKVVEDGKLVGMFDRVVMNLPTNAIEYLDVACKAVKREGGIVHCYMFAKGPDPTAKSVEKVLSKLEKYGRKGEVLLVRRVKPSAPFEWLMVVDVKV
jgi:tRNA (guanine37-N1)-methyltransferase